MNTPKRSIDGVFSRKGSSNVKPVSLKSRPYRNRVPPMITLQPRQHVIDIVRPESVIEKRSRRSFELPDKDVVLSYKTHTLRARLVSVVGYIIYAAIALSAAYSTSIGQWFVLLFAIYVLVSRKPSHLSFGAALLVLISLPIFQLLGQSGVANNMAVYVYELLVVGTIQAVIELKWPRHSA